MANYRKSFNFRTGLQVDNDNFVVNANGLVGIGTSIPENYLLNVYGDTRVTGVVTTATLNAGVGTVTTLSASNSTLGTAVVDSIQIAGGPVITDLVGYAYSTFITDAGGGISTTSRIGIGTISDTTDQLKVFGDTTFLGNIDISSGIVTALGFVGDITGNVTGNVTGDVIGNVIGNVTGTATTATNLTNGANIATGTISDDRLPDLITSDINSSGVSTFTTLKLGSNIEMSGVSGIITATSFSGPISGAVTGNADTATALETARDFSVSGDVATASAVSFDGTGNVDLAVTLSSSFDANTSGIITASSFVGDVTGTATTATNLTDGANITTGTISNDRLPDNINKPTGIITASSFVGDVTGTATTATNLTDGANITTGTISNDRLPDLITSNIDVSSGVSTVNELNVGTDGSALTALSTGRLGIGTALPSSELQIRKASGSLLEVISDSGQARISIGNSVGVGNSSGVLIFGSAERALEFINRDTGNLNMILHGGGSGIGTGRFGWLYGQTNAELLSLTYGGSLGIGITNPSNTLHVVGTSTVTGNAWVGGNLSVDGNISGTITLPSLITSNINVTSGVSTFNTLDVTGIVTLSTASSIGIGTTLPIVNFDARDKTALIGTLGVNTTTPATASLEVIGQSLFDSIGIGTTNSQGEGLYANGTSIVQHDATTTLYDSVLYIRDNGAIGVGTTAVRCQIDFADAGKTAAGLNTGESTGSRAYMLPPRLTNTQRVGLVTEAGAIIFNIDTNTFQGFDGTTWQDFH